MRDESIGHQLELHGLDAVRNYALSDPNPRMRARLLKQITVTHDLWSEQPGRGDLSFLHAGLCQTCLPHARPERNSSLWQRKSGNFTLIVTPGVLDPTPSPTRGKAKPDDHERFYVGVPYGARARLIMLYLQTEALKGSRQIDLGESLSAFLHSLGLKPTGGPNGTIASVKEQCLRISRCGLTMQWRDDDRTVVSDGRIVDRLELWSAHGESWCNRVELSENFYDHLHRHAVPLDRRGIALLSDKCLGLDLYALLAYRLPRLTNPLLLAWATLREQLGSDYAENKALAKAVRIVMPHVHNAYPAARVEILPTGLLLYRSPPAVPARLMLTGHTHEAPSPPQRGRKAPQTPA